MNNGLAYYETNQSQGFIEEINELLTRDKKLNEESTPNTDV